MNESDRRQRLISSTPRLSADEVASRTFPKGVRGFSEPEVRGFLRRVSEELAIARAREQELERALGDLVRRRSLLNSQIEALRGGRDRLLDAYRTVKRTFLDATEALQQVEARVAVERSTSSNEAIDVAAEIAAEIEKLDIAGPGELDDATGTPAPGDARAEGSGEGR